MTPKTHKVLATRSRKLQNRVAEIVNVLTFQGDETSELMAAIAHYKAKDGQVAQTAPLGFLEPQEQQAATLRLGDNPCFAL